MLPLFIDSALPKTPAAEGLASVAGTVLDPSGATVSGADVDLMHSDGTQSHTMLSDANGEFSFLKILPGSYLVVVNGKGFAAFTSVEFLATDQQVYELPDISLSVATASIEVIVRPTDRVAAEQIRAAEKQRLMGVIPNFYTSYIYDAAPLTWKQKFSLAVRGTFDQVAFIGVGFAAGIEQANNSFAGYGQGASGYGKRYAAKFVDGRSSDLLTHAVFPTLLHQDPRYYYQGSGSFKSRLMHAVGSAFVTRSDSGHTEPNYSYFLGDVCSAALSNLYYPPANRGVSLVFNRAAVGLAGRVGGNLIREFLSKRLTTALTIAQLYRARWKVELFFRWIKQHLRIKAFYGTSENAVKTQAWVALSVYVLVAIVKKQLGLDLSLYKILQILSVTVFEKTPILEGFSNFSDEITDAEPCIQLNLFDF